MLSQALNTSCLLHFLCTTCYALTMVVLEILINSLIVWNSALSDFIVEVNDLQHALCEETANSNLHE